MENLTHALRSEKYPNYFIREDGLVWSSKFKRFLKPKVSNSGYLFVTLCSGSRSVTPRGEYIHRLVASSFLGEPPVGASSVNHINGNKKDNRRDNLEWATPQSQMDHALGTGLIKTGKDSPLSKRTAEREAAARKLRAGGFSYASIGYVLGIGGDTVRRWLSPNYIPVRRRRKK